MTSSLKPTLNLSRPQLKKEDDLDENALLARRRREEEEEDEDKDRSAPGTKNDDGETTTKTLNDNNNNNTNNNILPNERAQILKTFEAPTEAMTLSEFKNCLMKKRVGELRELLDEEEEDEDEDGSEKKKKKNSNNKKKKNEEEEKEQKLARKQKRRKLEIEQYALAQTLAGAKSRFEAERVAAKHTEAMQRVRAAKQEANAAI